MTDNQTLRDELRLEGMHALVRHISWVPFEFRRDFLRQYRRFAELGSPQLLMQALKDVDPKVAQL